MDVDTPSESPDAVDSLSESSGDYSVASDGGAAASAESTAEEKPAIYVIQDVPRKSKPADLGSSVPSVSKRRFTHIPERRACLGQFVETHPNLRRIRREYDLSFRHRILRKYRRSGYLETLFELPFDTENNVVIFSRPQKLRRSVDEVDQLMRKLDLHKDKSKMT